MSDFISRSALIKKLREKSVKDEVNTLSTTYTYKELAYIICNMPTAYDVEKVVAELEEKIKDVEKIIVTPPQDKLDEIANDTAKDFIGAWKSAIKAVRKGRVE